ncbi:uncharacterized protein EI90DRAFT_3039436 [Cantharellus anzutake]|uniref:uncharacterized protein n=1 Tax=Cantharellus anzutake TaxID=1750568 RepID=UPI0019041ADC|nr:uncharacterized protein EI90DRAFT_3039436 [Cantharellus anzutake]KAF8338855.1 hypothetical protein EI90DRAFT_3039436 [Cantharellus anzutake]
MCASLLTCQRAQRTPCFTFRSDSISRGVASRGLASDVRFRIQQPSSLNGRASSKLIDTSNTVKTAGRKRLFMDPRDASEHNNVAIAEPSADDYSLPKRARKNAWFTEENAEVQHSRNEKRLASAADDEMLEQTRVKAGGKRVKPADDEAQPNSFLAVTVQKANTKQKSGPNVTFAPMPNLARKSRIGRRLNSVNLPKPKGIQDENVSGQQPPSPALPVAGYKRERERLESDSGSETGRTSDAPPARKRGRERAEKPQLSKLRESISLDENETKNDQSVPDENVVVDPLCGGRRPGEEWESGGLKFKVGVDGRRLRKEAVVEKRPKYQMPLDSQHRDKAETINVWVDNWFTEEEYLEAKAKGIFAWQQEEKKAVEAESAASSASSTRRPLSGRSSSTFWDAPDSTTPPKVMPLTDLDFNPFFNNRQRTVSRLAPAPQRPRTSVGSAGTIPQRAPSTRWQKQANEQEALRQLREARKDAEERKRASETPAASVATPAPAPAVVLTAPASMPPPSTFIPTPSPFAPVSPAAPAPTPTTASTPLVPAKPATASPFLPTPLVSNPAEKLAAGEKAKEEPKKADELKDGNGKKPEASFPAFKLPTTPAFLPPSTTASSTGTKPLFGFTPRSEFTNETKESNQPVVNNTQTTPTSVPQTGFKFGVTPVASSAVLSSSSLFSAPKVTEPSKETLPNPFKFAAPTNPPDTPKPAFSVPSSTAPATFTSAANESSKPSPFPSSSSATDSGAKSLFDRLGPAKSTAASAFTPPVLPQRPNIFGSLPNSPAPNSFAAVTTNQTPSGDQTKDEAKPSTGFSFKGAAATAAANNAPGDNKPVPPAPFHRNDANPFGTPVVVPFGGGSANGTNANKTWTQPDLSQGQSRTKDSTGGTPSQSFKFGVGDTGTQPTGSTGPSNPFQSGPGELSSTPFKFGQTSTQPATTLAQPSAFSLGTTGATSVFGVPSDAANPFSQQPPPSPSQSENPASPGWTSPMPPRFVPGVASPRPPGAVLPPINRSRSRSSRPPQRTGGR